MPERESVQSPLIEYAADIGWEYLSPDDCFRLRGGGEGFILRDVFTDQLQKLNPAFLDHLLAHELIKRFDKVRPNVEGNMEIWEHLCGLRTVFVPDEKRERNVTFLDKDDLDRNTFYVTDEFSFKRGKRAIRPDVVFLVNGVPVVFVEAKAADRLEGMVEALEQVRRYEADGPELMAVLQVVTLTHILKFYYGPTWNLSGKSLINWRDEQGDGTFEGLVKSFFERRKVLDLVTDYILFARKDDELKKVVLRPHQIRAVEKVAERSTYSGKDRGLVWHTQGSGKTYSMIIAAKEILDDPKNENPTVIMLVDRTELQQQLFNNLSAVGFSNLVVTESKRNVEQLLADDYRGLLVSMIHKFEGIPENVNTRKNVFVLVDEAHRTTSGELGNYLMGAVPNATIIGFTGTPIDRSYRGKSTFVTFGKDDPPHGYLDKYGLAESVADGATVPLHYSLASSDLLVDKETLEKEFLDLAEAEGVSDVEELNRVLEKAVTLREMMKNPDRIGRVAEYVAKHYKETVEPMGYKAFLVAVDREACALYKDALDKYLPPEYSRVVYSSSVGDGELIAKYHLSENEEKDVRKKFTNAEELPKIIIVTEKLLTGFDAPILYIMYLDKPMRDHVLLQAIARVNRPHEDDTGRRKRYGFILDFVGIFDDLEKALAFDSSDITGVVESIEVLKERFVKLMGLAADKYLPIIKGKEHDKRIEAILNYFMEEEKRDEYYRFYNELSDIYEILSPDQFLRPYVDDYKVLSEMYYVLRGYFGARVDIDEAFTRKTKALVREGVKAGEIHTRTETYVIDGGTLRLVDESDEPDIVKVFNLIKSIAVTVAAGKDKKAYLIPIGERAEEIARLYTERQKSTQEALEELLKLVEEVVNAEEERQKSDMDDETFSVFVMLKDTGIKEPERTAAAVVEAISTYPNWMNSRRDLRGFKTEFYKILRGNGVEDYVVVGKKIIDALAESKA